MNLKKQNGDIVFVISTLQSGGAERVVSTLAARFHEHKYRVRIVCLNSAEPAYQLPESVIVTSLVNRRSDRGVYRMYYAVLTFTRLIWLLLSTKPQCVISFMTTANLWAGITCFLTHTRYIVSERTTPDHTINTYKGLLKWLSFFSYRNARAIVVPSKGIADCLKKNSRFRNLTNYSVIRNPINNPGSFSGKKVNSKRFILGVGRLSYEKGFDQLIAAFKESQTDDTDLLIAGEGIELNKLKQQIASLSLQNRVKLIGLKENLNDYYSQAELFVLPSRNEGYPNALIEAMSMGCSCIAMDCEFGPAEIITHLKNGLLVEDKNVEKLSSAISTVLNNPILKEKIAMNARLINDTNSIDTISHQWEDLIFSK